MARSQSKSLFAAIAICLAWLTLSCGGGGTSPGPITLTGVRLEPVVAGTPLQPGIDVIATLDADGGTPQDVTWTFGDGAFPRSVVTPGASTTIRLARPGDYAGTAEVAGHAPVAFDFTVTDTTAPSAIETLLQGGPDPVTNSLVTVTSNGQTLVLYETSDGISAAHDGGQGVASAPWQRHLVAARVSIQDQLLDARLIGSHLVAAIEVDNTLRIYTSSTNLPTSTGDWTFHSISTGTHAFVGASLEPIGDRWILRTSQRDDMTSILETRLRVSATSTPTSATEWIDLPSNIEIGFLSLHGDGDVVFLQERPAEGTRWATLVADTFDPATGLTFSSFPNPDLVMLDVARQDEDYVGAWMSKSGSSLWFGRLAGADVSTGGTAWSFQQLEALDQTEADQFYVFQDLAISDGVPEIAVGVDAIFTGPGCPFGCGAWLPSLHFRAYTPDPRLPEDWRRDVMAPDRYMGAAIRLIPQPDGPAAMIMVTNEEVLRLEWIDRSTGGY